MIVTLEDGSRYEISADERKFRIAPSEEWTRAYSVDAHPIAYSSLGAILNLRSSALIS